MVRAIGISSILLLHFIVFDRPISIFAHRSIFNIEVFPDTLDPYTDNNYTWVAIPDRHVDAILSASA